MFGIGSTELLVILVVALIILGPSKLPEIAKSLGKALGEFRRVSTDVKRTIEMEAEQEEQRGKTEKARKELFPEKDIEKVEVATAEEAPVEKNEAAPAGSRSEAAAPATGKDASA